VSHPLPLTGERTLPGVVGEEYWFARHEAAYAWLTRQCADRLRNGVVVEAGSGEGYGAKRIREAGPRIVLALEYDAAAAHHAARAYPEVATVRANLASMPIADESADVVVSLQVVEHLWALPAFLRDCGRVLRPGGLLVVSTPNRLVFSPGLDRGDRPTNPFHVEEFDADQLAGLLLDAGFADVESFGLHHGPRISAWERDSGTSIVEAQIAAVSALVPPAGLPAFVATVTFSDFVLGSCDGAQDLLALAVRA
jgi:SAM-dependent methyltransferase